MIFKEINTNRFPFIKYIDFYYLFLYTQRIFRFGFLASENCFGFLYVSNEKSKSKLKNFLIKLCIYRSNNEKENVLFLYSERISCFFLSANENCFVFLYGEQSLKRKVQRNHKSFLSFCILNDKKETVPISHLP